MATPVPPLKRRKTDATMPPTGSTQDCIHISDLARILVPHQPEIRQGFNGITKGAKGADFVSLETAYGTLDEEHRRHIILGAAMAVPALAGFLRSEHDRTRKSIVDFNNRVRDFDYHLSPVPLSDDFMGEEERKTAGYIRGSFHAIRSKVKRNSHFETKAHGLKALAEMANLLNSRMEDETFQVFMERHLYQGVFMDAMRSVIDCMTTAEKIKLPYTDSGDVWAELMRLNNHALFFDEFPETFRDLEEDSSRPLPETSEDGQADDDQMRDDSDEDPDSG